MYRFLHGARVFKHVYLPEIVGCGQEIAAVRPARRVYVREIREWTPYALDLPPETTRERGIIIADGFGA